MKTATLRDLRNHSTSVIRWVQGGEEVIITQRGKRVARLIPEKDEEPKNVNWAESPAVSRDRTHERMLTAEESSSILKESSGRW